MQSILTVEIASVLVAIACGRVTSNAALISLGRTNYFQNFDTLASSGKSKSLPAGWDYLPFGGASGQYFADDGSSSQGGLYSYGQIGSSDRALGTLRSGGSGNQQSGDFAIFGANFQNSGGGSISRLNISYTGEEWRLGAQGRGPDRLQFQYSLNANGVGDKNATWINDPALDFLTPNLAGVGAHNGNLAVNQSQILGVISFLNIPQGSTFWVRWVDAVLPHGGPEDGLAIDDFSIAAVPEAQTLAAGFAMALLLVVTIFRHGARRGPKSPTQDA
jgi:hypothetical protein